MKKNDQEIWFKAKRYGWGWTPVTWQGWVVTLMFILVVIATHYLYSMLPLSEGEFNAVFLSTIAGHTFVLIGICAYKGEPPRWRWGSKDTAAK